MAELPADNITVTAVCSALGISPVEDILLRDDLCNASNINKWSFYRSRPIELDGDLKVVLTDPPPTGDRKLGDFRRYDHNSFPPRAPDDFPVIWHEGDTEIEIIFAVRMERLNFQELIGGGTHYITIKYYLSSAARDSGSGSFRTLITAIDTSTETPPAGHTNNQTIAPATAIQLVTDPDFPVNSIGLSEPDDTVYCDVYLSNAGGTREITFDDNAVDLAFHLARNPYIDATGPSVGSAPVGYTAVFIVCPTGSDHTDYLAADQPQSWNSAGYSGFFYLCGIKGSAFYRVGSVGVTASLKIRNPDGGSLVNTTTVFSGTMPTAGTGNKSISGTLSSSYVWDYDDVGDIEVSVPDWTGFTEELLPGTPTP